MDGTERHCARIDIINLTEFMMPLRLKDGTFYDGTAALNILLRTFLLSYFRLDWRRKAFGRLTTLASYLVSE
jgi:hypothetical protein